MPIRSVLPRSCLVAMVCTTPVAASNHAVRVQPDHDVRPDFAVFPGAFLARGEHCAAAGMTCRLGVPGAERRE